MDQRNDPFHFCLTLHFRRCRRQRVFSYTSSEFWLTFLLPSSCTVHTTSPASSFPLISVDPLIFVEQIPLSRRLRHPLRPLRGTFAQLPAASGGGAGTDAGAMHLLPPAQRVQGGGRRAGDCCWALVWSSPCNLESKYSMNGML